MGWYNYPPLSSYNPEKLPAGSTSLEDIPGVYGGYNYEYLRMVPAKICKIHHRYHTPYIVTILGAIFVSLISGFAPIGIIAEMANIGTLSAFLIAAIGVLVLRVTKPELPRTFRCPAVWLIAPLAVAACGYLMRGTWPSTISGK